MQHDCQFIVFKVMILSNPVDTALSLLFGIDKVILRGIYNKSLSVTVLFQMVRTTIYSTETEHCSITFIRLNSHTVCRIQYTDSKVRINLQHSKPQKSASQSISLSLQQSLLSIVSCKAQYLDLQNTMFLSQDRRLPPFPLTLQSLKKNMRFVFLPFANRDHVCEKIANVGRQVA